MPYGLKDTHITAIKHILSSDTGIFQAILFGSRAKGNYKPGSDIDLALKTREFTFTDLLKISHQLDSLSLPWKFDLVIYDSITDSELKDHIQRTGIVVYEKALI
jgi:predicted nucleotidyltransferase